MCRYASLAISGSTRRTYSAGERRYLGFCAVCKWDPLPASDFMLSAFAAHIAGRVKPGTVRVYLAAVRNLHLDLGLPDPTADAALLPRVTKGISRAGLPGVSRPRLPITTVVLRQLVHVLLGSHFPIADRFMLHAAMLLAFHGCLRCGEFTTPVNYDHRRHASRGDVTMDSEGMQFRLKTSKTDPYGKGTTIEVGLCKPPMCATTAIRTYLTMTNGAPHDPLFRYKDGHPLSKKTFVDEVRRLLESASIDNASSYSGHSFRIGAATSAAMAGAPDWQIRAMGRWKSDSVLRYIRHDSSAMKGLAKLLTSSSND